MPRPETNLIDTSSYLYNVQFSSRQCHPEEKYYSSPFWKPEERPRVKRKGGRKTKWRRGGRGWGWEEEVALRCRGSGGAGEAGRKVEKTVSITLGTHRRIICWGWVNCDLRSVMTCNNFLSLLSVNRQGRSPQQGGGRWRQESRRKGGVGVKLESKREGT